MQYENPYQLGDTVFFQKGYHPDRKNKELVEGIVTSLYSSHCGVTPVGSEKELFFQYLELRKSHVFIDANK